MWASTMLQNGRNDCGGFVGVVPQSEFRFQHQAIVEGSTNIIVQGPVPALNNGRYFQGTLAMFAMLKRLEQTRQHLQLTFHGLATLALGRKLGDKHLVSQCQVMMKESGKLDSIGSFNARPAYLWLLTVDTQKQSAYDEAIAACYKSQLRHFEAIL